LCRRFFSGTTITLHAEITGDFTSAYAVKSTRTASAARSARRAIPPRRLRRNGWRLQAGDIVMTGCMKMNIMDLEKLRAMAPKPPPK